MANERFTNIWDALAATPEEAENLRIRSKLMMELSDTVRSWDLPQKEAAAKLHISQPRLNDVLKGKIQKFSLDALVNLLAAANMRIEISVSKSNSETVAA